MDPTVTLSNGQCFRVKPGETVLEAALREGIALPYGCRSGACGSCKARVSRGQPSFDQAAGVLSPEEIANGWVLLCCAKPVEDMHVETAPSEVQVRKIPCRVRSVTHVSQGVAIVKLQLPAGLSPFSYRAGQYVNFLLEGGLCRSYSIATAPSLLGDELSFHIRHVPGGRLTDRLFGEGAPILEPRSLIRVEGPLGGFFLRGHKRAAVFLASGTGLGPLKAMVEQMAAGVASQQVTLYWGVRRPEDLYLNELCVAWASSFPWFRYVPVVSEPTGQDDWSGRTGFVHLAVMEDYEDLSDLEVYACGSPVMVEAARRDFVNARRLQESHFYADAFLSETDNPRAIESGFSEF